MILIVTLLILYWFASIFCLVTFKVHSSAIEKFAANSHEIDLLKFPFWILSVIIYMVIVFPFVVHPVFLIKQIPHRSIKNGFNYLRKYPWDCATIFFGKLFVATVEGLKAK